MSTVSLVHHYVLQSSEAIYFISGNKFIVHRHVFVLVTLLRKAKQLCTYVTVKNVTG